MENCVSSADGVSPAGRHDLLHQVAAILAGEQGVDLSGKKDSPEQDSCHGTSPAPPKKDLQPLAEKANETSRSKKPHPTGCSSNRAGPGFIPRAPDSLEKAGLTEAQVEELILKFLAVRAAATGRETTEELKLPFGLIHIILRRMKEDRLVAYKAATAMIDYVYELTEAGRERARQYRTHCSYVGAAPVPLEDYAAAIEAQSVRQCRPRLRDLRRAFGDLVLDDEILRKLGQAINSGLALFLYGQPGNGKTSIAERVTRAFGEYLWIPQAILAAGEIIRLYDPSNHENLLQDASDTLLEEERIDRRWVCIRRPTIVAGGELTLDSLELSTDPISHVSEAPLQMKSNGGTLVIDDFGRQRIRPAELLNRWIVPLEKRRDYLSLPNGRKIEVPFDQLIIFSTNMEPRDLVDEAFLRRIPYKIDVQDPTEEQFRQMFADLAPRMGLECQPGSVDYLLRTHYTEAERPMRFCHARDLLHQVRVFCDFHERPMHVTRETLDAAVKSYFAVM